MARADRGYDLRVSTPRDPNKSPIRRGLLWWMAPPADPYVSMNVAVDVTAARAYLARLGGDDATRPTLQHLLLVAIGRAMAQYPQANARIVGGKIRPVKEVGAALPVNLLGHAAGARAELSLVVVNRLEARSLRDVAREARASVRNERGGKVENPVFGALMGFARHAPDRVLGRSLDVLDRALRQPLVAEAMFRALPATTVLSNVGAVVGGGGERLPDGLQVRAAHISPPPRLVHVGTVWGAAPVQDEVVPIAGRPEVRPMLPLVLVFDHRLIDGVLGARLVGRVAELMLDPEPVFGADGERTAQRSTVTR